MSGRFGGILRPSLSAAAGRSVPVPSTVDLFSDASAPGIVAHQSCLRDGERLKVPQYGKLARDASGAYTAVVDDGFYQHH